MELTRLSEMPDHVGWVISHRIALQLTAKLAVKDGTDAKEQAAIYSKFYSKYITMEYINTLGGSTDELFRSG